MNKKIELKLFEFISAIFIVVMGTLLHFVYEWSGKNTIVGIFGSVNESTWEHLKILFFPMLITIIIGTIYYRDISNYLCNKTKGLLISLLFIIAFFYTYSGILGTNITIIDILSFVVAIIIGEVYTYYNINHNIECPDFPSILILLVLTFSFIKFTFKPPFIGLFQDPINQSYGINKKEYTK